MQNNEYPDLCQEEVDEVLGKYPGAYILLNKRAYRKNGVVTTYDSTYNDPTTLILELREFERYEYLKGIYQLVKVSERKSK